MRGTTLALCCGVAAALVPRGGSAEDDLSVVRKAVAATNVRAPAVPATAEAPPRKADPPRWIRVRIREKGEEGAVVSLDLPLALVGALGGNGDLEDDQGHGRSKTRRSALGNALRALESGQPIIEIEAEDASVRVFVE